MNHDVVYFIKNKPVNEELRYSLRSVEKNFPAGKIWFYGGCPSNLYPDYHVYDEQTESSKYFNVRKMLMLVVNNKEISDDFYLFNDDFFVMSKVGYTIPTVDGSLLNKIRKIEKKYNGETSYTKRLEKTVRELTKKNLDVLNYELHIPMLINKEKAKKVFDIFDENTAFRSTYGNYYSLAISIQPDVKVMSLNKNYDPDIHNIYLSTSDITFSRGLIGQYIRSKFTEPSKWESREKHIF